ncbi:MAG TPA: hypothetical protein VHU40_01580 [Polyangia bacterium]|nr:hypothetical protein [Polyangia bacterium]
MIRYVVRQGHTYTIDEFLAGWGRPLRASIQVTPYESLGGATLATAGGVCLFSDIERLDGAERARMTALADDLVGQGVRVLNHPMRVLTRYPLLRLLADVGINRFRARRMVVSPRLRYPVFLRTDHAHDGNLTPLLTGRRQLLRALLGLARHPRRLRSRLREGLLAVEFEDTRDAAGLYRKYSVLRVGNAFVPRHAFVSRTWMLKQADIVDAHTAAAEQAFVRDNPHREQVARVFVLAGIDYGRMDYSVRSDGSIVVWEINTNPMVVPDVSRLDPLRVESQSLSAAQVVEAFRALDATS